MSLLPHMLPGMLSRRKNRRNYCVFLPKHLIGYFAAMLVLVPDNVLTTPGEPWFVLPIVGGALCWRSMRLMR